jgi:hypothetical protein
MTTSAQILLDGIDRVRQTSRNAGKDLHSDVLEARVDAESNTIAWLLWHIGRGHDRQVSSMMGDDDVWVSAGWSTKFNLDLPDESSGYGHSADDVAKVKGVSADDLLGYIDAVCDRSATFVAGLSDSDLDRVVDERFTPPVTVAVRMLSVISDDLQHAGQAAFIRGVLERRG